MISRLLLASSLLCGPLFSESVALISKNAPIQEKTQESTHIEGVFITGVSEDVLAEGRPLMKGLNVLDIELPGSQDELFALLQPYIGKKMTKENVIAIKKEIMTYYSQKGISAISVAVPKQKTQSGVIQFLITHKKLGQAHYKGDYWYNSKRLSRYLSVNPGERISEDALQNNLSWLNRNPFQRTSMRYLKSDDPSSIDIEFKTNSRFPFRPYASVANTGTETTGMIRYKAGFAWGNALWMGDIFSFEYSFSNLVNRFQSYTLNYTSFLPWKHILTVLGSHANVNPYTPNKRSTSKGTQIKPRYTIPIGKLYTSLQQSFMFGFDYKNSNSSIINLTDDSPTVQLPSGKVIPKTPAKQAPPKEINVTQLSASYSIYDTIGKHSVSFTGDFFISPFQFLDHQNDANYNKNRPNSKVKYCYFNATLADVITIPDTMVIALVLQGQIASRTLPSTELFSAGGYNTVRGYRQSVASGDNGFVGNLELRTKNIRLSPKLKDNLVLLAFLDYGMTHNWYVQKSKSKNVPTPSHTNYLLGVGPGLRYAINPYIQMRADYGFKLLKLPNPSGNKQLMGSGEFHFGLLASY